MNLATLFQRRKALQAELVRPLHKQRLDILRTLATGGELDEAEVFQVMDALEISEPQFYKDYDIQKERYPLAEQLEQRKQAAIDVTELTRESERLDAEYKKFMATLQPKRTAVFDRLREAEQVLLSTSSAEARLIATCLDTELIERGNELDTKRHKVGMELLALQDEVTTLRNRISYAKTMVDNAHLENSRMPLAFGDEKQKVRDRYKEHQVKIAQEKLADEQRAAQPTFAKYDKLKAEQQKLDDETRELNRLKLVP